MPGEEGEDNPRVADAKSAGRTIRESFALFPKWSVGRIHGLASPSGRQLNGRTAEVTGWDGKARRYDAFVADPSLPDGKRRIKVRPANLVYGESLYDQVAPAAFRERPPVHVLLSVRFDDTDANGCGPRTALFRARQCVRSIIAQSERVFSIFVLASDGCDPASGAEDTGSSTTRTPLDDFESFLRETVVSQALDISEPCSRYQMWYFRRAPDMTTGGTESSRPPSEMEQLRELCDMSSRVDPNAWLMPFSANDMMSKIRVQYLGDYLRKGKTSKEDHLNGLALTIMGKLVVTDKAAKITYSPDLRTTDWENDPALGSKVSYINQDVVDRKMSGYFDYCMHTSMLSRFFESLPPELMEHPFSSRRLDAVMLGLCAATRICREFPWAMIQYERPHVAEEGAFVRGYVHPNLARETMPLYYNLAKARLSEQDDVLAGRFKRLTKYTAAMWRLYFEYYMLMRYGWDDSYLDEHAKNWSDGLDYVNGVGFGRALWQQIYDKFDGIVTKDKKAEMKLIMDRDSHSVQVVKRTEAASIRDTDEEVYNKRIRTTLPTGKEILFHCYLNEVPGQHFEARRCKIPKDQRPYEGKDPNVTREKYCSMCHRPESTNCRALLRCKRCQLVYYCSRDCQVEDFAAHKDSCKKIKKLTDEVNSEEEEIASHPESYGFEVNPFQSEVGRFWAYPTLFPYIRNRATLANEILCVALVEDSVPMWEAALFHKLELLRLERRELQEPGHRLMTVKTTVPHILLYLNRDDDCYTFIRYYLRGHDDKYSTCVDKDSIPGDWVHGKETGSQFVDFVEEIEASDDGMDIPLSSLLALCIIKMRIVAHHKARAEAFQVFVTTSFGMKVEQVTSILSDFCVGDDETLAFQERQVERLLELIHERNRYILAAIDDPGTVQDAANLFGGAAGLLGVDGRYDAYITVQDYEKPFLRTPGAKEKLHCFLRSRQG